VSRDDGRPGAGRRTTLLIGIVIGVFIPPLAALAVAATGWLDMSATRPPGPVERLVGGMLADRSVERRAPDTRNPLPASPEVLAAGLEHYRENCVICHGAPGVPPGGAGKGLNPPAPDLARRGPQGSSDGELFQVIGHGIRMTGMPGWLPTHSEREIWEIVRFVRHLPALTASEREALAGGEAGEHHEGSEHHDEDAARSSPR